MEEPRTTWKVKLRYNVLFCKHLTLLLIVPLLPRRVRLSGVLTDTGHNASLRQVSIIILCLHILTLHAIIYRLSKKNRHVANSHVFGCFEWTRVENDAEIRCL